jgi:hypothetical protein
MESDRLHDVLQCWGYMGSDWTSAILFEPRLELCELVYSRMGPWIYPSSCALGIVKDIPVKVLEVYFDPCYRLFRQCRYLFLILNTLGSVQNVLISSFVVAVVFQFYALRYQNAWFKKYNYVFAASVSAGAGICVLLVNFLSIARDGEGNELIKQPEWVLNPKRHSDFYCFD